MVSLSLKANIDVDERRHNTIESAAAETTVGSATQLLLRQSLRLVNKYIRRLNKRKCKSEEEVHELRVAARRGLAGLRLCSELLPKNRVRRFNKYLKELLRNTGKTRDLDVLKKQLACGSGDYPAIYERLHKRRQRSQKQMLRYVRKLSKHGQFENKSRKLLRRLKDVDCSNNIDVHAWIQRNLSRIAQCFEDALPRATEDVKQLHRFRLQVKKTRYEVEQLSQLDPTMSDGTWRELIEDLQERLGNINDLANYLAQSKKWIHSLRRELSKEKRHQLLATARNRLQMAVNEFSQWWTPELQLRLRKHLRAIGATDDTSFSSATLKKSPKDESSQS